MVCEYTLLYQTCGVDTVVPPPEVQTVGVMPNAGLQLPPSPTNSTEALALRQPARKAFPVEPDSATPPELAQVSVVLVAAMQVKVPLFAAFTRPEIVILGMVRTRVAEVVIVPV